MKALRFLVVILLHFCLFPFSTMGQNAKLLETFPISSPEQQGINSSVLDSMLLFIMNTNQNIHHLTIIRNNQTVLATDIYPYDSQYLHDVASITKSLISILMGIVIDKGFIKHENELVLQFFPEVNAHNRLLDLLKIKDLVTMRSGFDCGVGDGEKALSNMRISKDWVTFIFNLPMTSKPGVAFSYCSCNFYLLGEIIYRATKLTPHEFAKKYLFQPLQISNSKWLTNYKEMNHGWGDLFLYPLDMAKIGQMVLDGGKWHGKQIVPEQWMKKSLQTLSKLPDDKGYGYGWWTNDKVGYYEAAGRGRQTISVIPSKNMVVIMLGGEFDADAIGKYIFESIKADKDLQKNRSDYNKLKITIKKIASAPSFEPAKMKENIIQKLNKRTIAFGNNIAGMDSMQFDFTSKVKGAVVFYKNGSKEKHHFVFSTNTYALSFDSTLQLPVALKACFGNENDLILHLNQLCRINNFYFRFQVKGKAVTTTMEETSNFIKVSIPSWFK